MNQETADRSKPSMWSVSQTVIKGNQIRQLALEQETELPNVLALEAHTRAQVAEGRASAERIAIKLVAAMAASSS